MKILTYCLIILIFLNQIHLNCENCIKLFNISDFLTIWKKIIVNFVIIIDAKKKKNYSFIRITFIFILI